MPKKLLAVPLGTCAAFCMGGALGQSEVQIYGRLNVSSESMSAVTAASLERQRQWRMSNNRSVLGFRGAEDLGKGLKVLFQIEGTVSPDTGAGALAQRDTRIGLAGGFGTVFFGHWGTAYNSATAGLDPFYPTTAGSSSILGNGSAPSTDNVSNLASFDRRQANSVHYWSPAWNGVSLRVTHGMNEEKPGNGARPSLTSLAGIYENGPWYLTLAHERHHEYHGPGGDDKGTKIGVAYAVGQTRIAAVAERLAYRLVNGDLARRAVFVSLSHQMGAHGLRATLTHAYDGEGPAGALVGTIKSGPDTGATHVTLGYEYALSKRTAAYAYYTCLDNDRNAVHDFAINGLAPRAGSTLKGSMLGLRHAF